MTRKSKLTPAPRQSLDRPADRRLHRRLLAAKEALERIHRGESPSAEELAAAPLLEFWCIVVDEPCAVLQGVVTGHPRIPDGHLIATSALLWIAPDETAARTVSRFYRLGVPLGEAMSQRS